MAADALAPCEARTLATVVLSMQDKRGTCFPQGRISTTSVFGNNRKYLSFKGLISSEESPTTMGLLRRILLWEIRIDYEFMAWVSIYINIIHKNLWYSVSPIYRSRVYRRIGYIAVACWSQFFGDHERDIFREIAVTLWTQFAGNIFREICSPRYSLCSRSRETIVAKSTPARTLAYLSMRAGTHAVRWPGTLGGPLTLPLCHRVGSS